MKMDRAFLKKASLLLRPGSIGYEREAFALMHAEKSNHTVSRMARLLEVSRSGFYAWSKRLPSKRAIRAEKIEAKIAWFHGESDEVSGSPRILADLREDGEVISRKTVAKAMRRLGLRGICPRRWRTTTQRATGDTYPPDATNRQWDTGVLNAVWVGDITYLRTWEGWLYLATVIDAHSRRVIGWAIADHMRTELVEDALKMAITVRGELPAQVVFHSDRGILFDSRSPRGRGHVRAPGGATMAEDTDPRGSGMAGGLDDLRRVQRDTKVLLSAASVQVQGPGAVRISWKD